MKSIHLLSLERLSKIMYFSFLLSHVSKSPVSCVENAFFNSLYLSLPLLNWFKSKYKQGLFCLLSSKHNHAANLVLPD